MSKGGHAPHQPPTCLIPGPSIQAPEERVPGEAPEGPKDQPTQVGGVLPYAQALCVCGGGWGSEWLFGDRPPSGAVNGEDVEVGMALREM